MSYYKWLPMIQDSKPDCKWLRMNTSKNAGELGFIVISVDNSDVTGEKQSGRLSNYII